MVAHLVEKNAGSLPDKVLPCVIGNLHMEPSSRKGKRPRTGHLNYLAI